MTRQIIVQILGDESKLDKSLGSATASSTRFGNVLQGIGQKIGQKGFDLVGQAVSKVTDFIGGSIDAASDLNETLSKSSVVFGQYAGDIETWGDNSAKALGLSKQAAVESAATFGNLFEGAGFAQQGAADLSKSVVQLAADLGSFNNIDSEEALEKLRSGLVGEAEPLRTLGVNLSEATMEAKATQLGFTKVNGVFTDAQKIQARYAVILDQTKNAQGDFARTADGLANSQKIANAELEDEQAKLGTKLLPLQLAVTRAQIGLIDSIDTTSKAFAGMGDALDSKAAPSLANAVKKTHETADFLSLLTGGVVDLTDTLDPLDKALQVNADMLTHAGKAADDAVDPFIGIGKASDDVRGASSAMVRVGLDPATEAMYNAGIAADIAAPQVHDFFDKYSVTAQRGDIAKDTLALLDNNKAVAAAQKAVEAAKPGTDAYKRAQLELTSAQGDLAAAHEKLIQDQITLFNTKPDAKTAKALDKYFNEQGLNVRNLTGDALRAYQAIQKMLHPFVAGTSLSITLALAKGNDGGQKLAGGGHLKRGETALVGEEGPELFTAPSAGSIVPLVLGGGGGGGGGPVININIGGGAYIDGPSIDRLVTLLTTRMRYATGL